MPENYAEDNSTLSLIEYCGDNKSRLLYRVFSDSLK